MGNSESRVAQDLLYAIVINREGAVVNILKKHPQMANAPLMGGVTNPICRASYLGYRKLVAILISNGADVNMTSSEGNTPLIWAAHKNNVKLIRLLLESGANP